MEVLMDETTKAYIAGFLDADGSIFLQLVRRHDYVFGYQIRASIAFYQQEEGSHILHWLKDQFGIGYIRSRRGIGKSLMYDYTIVGWQHVRKILLLLQPYVRLKAAHIKLALRILELPEQGLSPQAFVDRCVLVDQFQTLNYSKKRSIFAHHVRAFLGTKLLIPVTTEGNLPEIVRRPFE